MRYFLFSIGEKYNLRAEWLSIRRFIKARYFFLYFSAEKNHVAKRQFFRLVVLGLAMQLSKPYNKKFSYKNMPKIQGRRKVQ